MVVLQDIPAPHLRCFLCACLPLSLQLEKGLEELSLTLQRFISVNTEFHAEVKDLKPVPWVGAHSAMPRAELQEQGTEGDRTGDLVVGLGRQQVEAAQRLKNGGSETRRAKSLFCYPQMCLGSVLYFYEVPEYVWCLFKCQCFMNVSLRLSPKSLLIENGQSWCARDLLLFLSFLLFSPPSLPMCVCLECQPHVRRTGEVRFVEPQICVPGVIWYPEQEQRLTWFLLLHVKAVRPGTPLISGAVELQSPIFFSVCC